jgi:hypothetical protein
MLEMEEMLQEINTVRQRCELIQTGESVVTLTFHVDALISIYSYGNEITNMFVFNLNQQT